MEGVEGSRCSPGSSKNALFEEINQPFLRPAADSEHPQERKADWSGCRKPP